MDRSQGTGGGDGRSSAPLSPNELRQRRLDAALDRRERAGGNSAAGDDALAPHSSANATTAAAARAGAGATEQPPPPPAAASAAVPEVAVEAAEAASSNLRREHDDDDNNGRSRPCEEEQDNNSGSAKRPRLDENHEKEEEQQQQQQQQEEEEPPSNSTLKILSWNISNCMPSAEAPYGFDNESAIINEILAQHADVLCLQECPYVNWRPASLSNQYRCWGSTLSHSGYVQIWTRNTLLFGQPLDNVPGPSVAVLLLVGETSVAISSSHLAPFGDGAPERKKQMRALTRFLKQQSGAAVGIMAGDFNMRQAEDVAVENSNGLQDAWKSSSSAWQKKNTWDSNYNKYHGPDAFGFNCRFDRIYFYYDNDNDTTTIHNHLGLTDPVQDAFDLFANRKRNYGSGAGANSNNGAQRTFCLSDHFGMVCSFSVPQPQPQPAAVQHNHE